MNTNPTGSTADLSKLSDLVFARHETFSPRYGWLKKAYEAVVEEPLIFSRPDAALTLGVGKNMARSIRYWAMACGVLKTREGHSTSTGNSLEPTELGRDLFDTNGWDPFLEDLGSLWLLHWQLLRADGIATAWYYAFNEFGLLEFTVDDLTGALELAVNRRHQGARRLASSSFRKDAVCITQMYAGGSLSRALSEESIRSPFTQLELLGEGSGARQFAFRVGDKPGLSPELVAALSVDFLRARGTALSIPLATLLRGQGSPGLALRLSETALYDYLDRAARLHPALYLGDTAGVIQLSVSDAPSRLYHELLDAHFVGSAFESVSS